MNAPVMNLGWVLLECFCQNTGYTVKAIRRKIEDGKWIEGKQYRKAPDGRITISIEGYSNWVQGKE